MKDSAKTVVMKVILQSEMFVRKHCDLEFGESVKKISTMKTEKECLCFQEVEAVRNFNLQGIFVLSQAIFYQN